MDGLLQNCLPPSFRYGDHVFTLTDVDSNFSNKSADDFAGSHSTIWPTPFKHSVKRR